MKPFIRFNAPFTAGNELEYIQDAIKNGRLSGDGKYTKACHKWLEQEIGCHTALLTHSGTAALEMAAILLDPRPGDEVILPSFTFVTSANAFVLRGMTPVFIDIDPDTLNMAPNQIEDAITDRTRAIVPVHYAGYPCEMSEICRIADKYNLTIIEDAAHAILGSYKDQKLGSIGAMACLSFHETKNIISGEGGALLINDPTLARRARIIWEKGTNRDDFLEGKADKYTWVDLGSSFLPSELTAAYLYAQFEHAEEIFTKRQQSFAHYNRAFQTLEAKGFVQRPRPNPHGAGNGHMFYLLTKNLQERNALIDHLKTQNIAAAFHYVPLHSSPAGKKYGRFNTELSVTDTISERLLRLPVYFRMTPEDRQRVIHAVYDFYGVEYGHPHE